MKMFSIFFKATIAFLIFSGAASAQTIDLTYKSSDGKTSVNLQNARTIKAVVDGIVIETAASNTATFTLTDVGGAVYAAITSDPKFLAIYNRVGATTQWANVTQSVSATCASNKSRVLWTGLAQYSLQDYADTCALSNALLTRTVN